MAPLDLLDLIWRITPLIIAVSSAVWLVCVIRYERSRRVRKAARLTARKPARPGTAVALAPKVILLEDVKFVPHARTGEGPHVEWIL